MDPYMRKMASLLIGGKARLDRLAVSLRSPAPSFSALARRRKLIAFEARYTDVSRRFELLRGAGGEGIAELKIGLEKAWDAFQAEVGWKA